MFLNNCCLNILIFSLIVCNCYIIVFSLVDKRAGFLTRMSWVLIPFQSIFFFLQFFFFSFSFFLNNLGVFLGSNIALPPPPDYFIFLTIVQYLYVHCTIPPILGSHHPYPTSPLIPNLTTNQPPRNPLIHPDHPDWTRTRTPPPTRPSNIFFAFSQ